MSIPETLLNHIHATLSEYLKISSGILQVNRAVSGGDINEAWIIKFNEQQYFLKVNAAELKPMFDAEYLNLEALVDATNNDSTLRCPRPLCVGQAEGFSYLLMEYLDLHHVGDEAILGRALARLHKHTHASFGWSSNNYIGRSTQLNKQKSNWCEFWIECRLQPQLEMAADRGYAKQLEPQQNRLIHSTQTLLGKHKPPASLLHGDLWSGNKAWLNSGAAVIYDPACYYGDRETDLALSELFGGFGSVFYDAYNSEWMMDQCYAMRKPLYNLYHMLNHLTLFGSGYLSSCLNLIDKINAHASS